MSSLMEQMNLRKRFSQTFGALLLLQISLKKHRQKIWRSIARLDWSAITAMVLCHMGITYLGLMVFQEEALLEPVTFAYYYFTTASTIGYGDLSPVTDCGRVFAFVWIFPGALSFYMALLAKVTQSSSSIWRKRMDGYGDFSQDTGRTIIMGYMVSATQRVVRDLLAGGLQERDILLIATRKPDFDLGDIDFVLTEDLANPHDMIRGGVHVAKNVLVMGPNDDATFTAALAVSHATTTAHIVAALECETRGDLLRSHTSVVPVISQPPEVVASEVLDPGIGQVLSVLGAATTDATAFSFTPEVGEISAGLAYAAFRQLGMTFLGVQCPKAGLTLNPPDDQQIGGMTLYYIAAERVNPNSFKGAILNQKSHFEMSKWASE